MRAVTFAALAVIGAVAGCAPPAAQQSPELAAMTERWEAALNSGDAEAVAALYSDDARLLPPNAEVAQGRAAVAAEFSQMTAAGLKVDLEDVEVIVSGDVGYKVGSYTLQGPGGEPIDRGKYIDVWRRIGGEWKITNDTWNSSLPVAAGGTTVVITHEVEDADRWLNAFRGENSRREMFAQQAGVSTVRTFQNPETPNLTALVLDVSDMATFEAFLKSEAAATAKAEDGVKDATMRVFLEAK